MTVDENDVLDRAFSAYTAHVILDGVLEISKRLHELPFEKSMDLLDQYNKDICEVFETGLNTELLIPEDRKTIEEAYTEWRRTYVQLNFNRGIYKMFA